MKKFLSLVLALVMTMSLVTISAGAKDFVDTDDITYVEAVDVMSEIGVVDGDLAGNFNPTNGLTRGAAAKIICNMILGPTTAAELNADTNPFPDVDKDSTYAGYIAYCAKEGIVGGYADGTFKQANPLTGYAFMKMLLGALGYDPAVEGYGVAGGAVEPNWSINVAKQAIGIGLNAGLVDEFNGSDYVTREEAMLYAFNTLKATMVDYDTTITIGDITVAGSNEYDVANNARVEGINEDNKMQFAEKYFTKLSVEESTDAFGRPTNDWTFNKKSVGSYVDYTKLVASFEGKVTGKDLYNALTSTVIKNNTGYVFVDGKDNNFNAADLGKNKTATLYTTGNGVVTEVYFDNDAEEFTIAVIDTYLAVADSDYNEKMDNLNLTIYGLNAQGVKDAGVNGDTKDADVSAEDFALAAEAKEDDYFLVTYADGAVQSMTEVETVDAVELKSFKLTESVTTTEGDTYKYSSTATYDKEVLDNYSQSNMKETTYKLYVDAYGHLIGIEEVESAKNYVFIAGYEAFSSILTNAKTEAFAIFMDGTTDTITVKKAAATLETAEKVAAKAAGTVDNTWSPYGKANLNKWFTYTVDKNGDYTLTPVATAIDTANGVKMAQGQDTTDGKELNKAHVSLKDSRTSYANDETVFLAAKLDQVGDSLPEQIVGVASVTTGIKNVNFELDVDNAEPNGAYYLFDHNGWVVAAVVVAENLASSSNYAYIIGDVSQEDYDATEDEWTWHRAAVVDGVEVVLKEKGDTLTYLKKSNTVDKWNWVEVYYDADGYVMDVKDVHFDASNERDGDSVAVSNVAFFNGAGTPGADYDKEDVILVEQAMSNGSGYALTLDGHTVYVNNNGNFDWGIDIMPDAVAAVFYTQDGVASKEYFADESGNVADAIDMLENTVFNGTVYFVMDDGVATAVIIKVDDPWTTKSATGTTPVANVSGISVAKDKDNKLVVTLTGPAAADKNVVTVSMLVGGVEKVVGTYEVTGTTATLPVVAGGAATYFVTCGNAASSI